MVDVFSHGALCLNSEMNITFRMHDFRHLLVLQTGKLEEFIENWVP